MFTMANEKVRNEQGRNARGEKGTGDKKMNAKSKRKGEIENINLFSIFHECEIN